ncbi:MAG: hypothetical protein ABMA64_40310, partial [Myxococcota bacterium]
RGTSRPAGWRVWPSAVTVQTVSILRLLTLLVLLFASFGAARAESVYDAIGASAADASTVDGGCEVEPSDDDEDDDESHRPAVGQWSVVASERLVKSAAHADRPDQHRAAPVSPPPRG